MRSLPELGEFDLVWSVADAVNYLHSHAELVAAFEGFRRNLAPGGVVVFDVDTLGTFRALYSSLMVIPAGDRAVVFEGRGTEPIDEGTRGRGMDRPPGAGGRAAVVEPRSHGAPAAAPSAPALERALAAAGLACVAVWGTDGAGGLEQPLDELRHSKGVYLAQLAAPTREGR